MMARDIKGWEIENPAWRDYSKTICTKDHFWRGIYGSGFYLGEEIERVMFDYPNTADHFYYLWYSGYQLDIIFASYKIDEIKRFIKSLNFTDFNKRTKLYVVDAVTKEHFVGREFEDIFIGGD